MADVDADAWAAAVVAAGGTIMPAQDAAMQSFIPGLKTDGIFSKLTGLWPIYADAGVTAAGAYIDIVARLAATAVGSPTWAGKDGVVFNGTTQYLDLNSLGGGTLDSQSFGVDLVTNAAASTAIEIGSSATTGVSYGSSISVKYTGDLLTYAVNDGNTDTGRAAPANTTGIYVVTRTAAAVTAVYKDGSSFATGTIASTLVPNQTFLLGACYRNVGTVAHFSTSKYAMAFLATALTSTDASNLTTRWNTYKTTLANFIPPAPRPRVVPSYAVVRATRY